MARGKSIAAILILMASLTFSSTSIWCAAPCGDANGDGELNVGDAVFMINYVFKGGPAPDSTCCSEGCLIDNVSYAPGASNPENGCEYCNPELSQNAWTWKDCDDGNDCTDDSCDPSDGACHNDCVTNGSPCVLPESIGECMDCVCTETTSQGN